MCDVIVEGIFVVVKWLYLLGKNDWFIGIFSFVELLVYELFVE